MKPAGKNSTRNSPFPRHSAVSALARIARYRSYPIFFNSPPIDGISRNGWPASFCASASTAAKSNGGCARTVSTARLRTRARSGARRARIMDAATTNARPRSSAATPVLRQRCLSAMSTSQQKFVETVAREKGLTIVGPEALTVRRQRRGTGFCFRLASGAPLRDPKEIARLKALAVPPAYADVRFAADASAHLQAVGTDAAGRL